MAIAAEPAHVASDRISRVRPRAVARIAEISTRTPTPTSNAVSICYACPIRYQTLDRGRLAALGAHAKRSTALVTPIFPQSVAWVGFPYSELPAGAPAAIRPTTSAS